MSNVSQMKVKVTLFAGVALIVGVAFWAYLNNFLYKSKAAQPNVNVTMAPKAATIGTSEAKTIEVVIQPADAGNKMSGVDITFLAEGNAKMTNISAPVTFPGNDATIFTQVLRNVTTSKAKLSYVITRPQSELPTAVKFSITLEGTGEGSGALKVDGAATQIVGNIAGYAYALGTVDQGAYAFSATIPTMSPTPTTQSGTITPTPTTGSGNPTPTTPVGVTVTVTPTVTQGPAGNMRIILKTRFQGITRSVGDGYVLSTKVTLANSRPGFQPQTKSVDFRPTAGEPGNWTGETSFDALPGRDFYLLVKGPKHMQKKICEFTPKETSPGTYRCNLGALTLNDGANATVDMSGMILLVGDLPDQDGIVDSYDIALVRQNLGKNNVEALVSSDMNLDGRVDTQDYSLMISALSVRRDEE